MAGYAARTMPSTGSLDELEGNVVWLRTQDSQVVLISLDLLAITSGLREAIVACLVEATGIPPECVFVAASHTHSAALGWVGEIHPGLPGELDTEMVAELAEKLAQVAAALSPQPVEVSFACGSVDDAATNRHDVGGPFDNTMGVLCISDLEGDLLAVVYDFACHPTVLGPGNLKWSADWVGAARSRIRSAVGNTAVVHLQGCAGDISTRFTRRESSPQELTRLGDMIGRGVLETVAVGIPIDSRLRIWRRNLLIRTRRDSAPLGVGDRSAGGRLRESLREGREAAAAIATRGLPPELSLSVSVLRLGHTMWLLLPVEPFASFGLATRAGRSHVRVAGYVDGCASYVPDAPTFESGQYEALAALLDQQGSAAFYTEARQLLDKCVAAHQDADVAAT